MSLNTRSQKILEQAKDVACKVTSWADFSNRMFDQKTGLVAKTFPEEVERQAFYDTDEYQQINLMLADLMRKYGMSGGANPKEKSGKFMVRVPKTVHLKLDIEAKREGISLNQLALSKLAVPLNDGIEMADDIIIDSFNKSHDGRSVDFLIIHPELDLAFLDECKKGGAGTNARALNHRLMNIRKTKTISWRLNKTTKRMNIKGYDEFEFASEIAVRSLQRTEGATLDNILCDPELLSRFDTIASQLVKGFDAFHLRAGALNLRKSHNLKPIDRSVEEYDLVAMGPVKSVNLSTIEELPGLYVFYDFNRPVFAGETENLRGRINRHLEGGIPQWAWDEDTLDLRMCVMPSVKQEDRRDWLMHFINTERPVLNYQKAA